MEVTLFFTYDTSLKDWESAGILSRELSIYKKLHNENNIKFNFITYGNAEDLEIDTGEGIEVYPLYEKRKRSNYKFVKIFKSLMIPFFFRDIIRNSSILKTNQLKGCWVGLISKTFFKKPLIVRTGYDLMQWSIFQDKNKFNRTIVKQITKYAIKISDQYNVSSDIDSMFLKSSFKNLNTNNIQLRPNFIDTSIFTDMESERNKEILLVGRLEDQKNLEFIIKEYENFNLPKLNIVGDGSKKNYLLNQINSKSLNIEYHGKVLNNKLTYFYNKFEFYLIASHYEGNPKSLLEAMACGNVVIGSNVTGINNIIKHKENGLLFELEYGNLSKQINLILDGSYDLNILKLNSIKFIKETHSLNELSKLELNDYRTILND